MPTLYEEYHKFSRLLAILNVLVALIVALGVGLVVSKLGICPQKTTRADWRLEVIERDVQDLRRDLFWVTGRFEGIEEAVDAAISDANNLARGHLQAEIEEVSVELKSLRDALGTDVERALSVPLLRKDFQEIEEQLNERTLAASREIDRIYDLNKWFLTLMGAMALSVLGLAINNFLQLRSKETDA